MRLFWTVRYLDRADKQFKSRCLYLQTNSLDPVSRAAVEFVIQNESGEEKRHVLKYRNLFVECKPGFVGDPNESKWRGEEFRGFFLPDYFEDETGQEIAWYEIGAILTGDPKAVLIPPGVRQHDLDLMFSERKPIPDKAVSLNPEEVQLLGYFVRDLKELQESAFMKEGPGTLGQTLTTATTDDEIRSFVTIFRRLYMEKEPANFQKAVAVFAKALYGHPLGSWVTAVASELQKRLAGPQDFRPIIPLVANFTTKRLIDVFIYTQYAHQPDKKRQKQFADCLAEAQGNHPVLTWFFLTEIWKCAIEMGNAGKIVSEWFDHWCNLHGVSPDVLNSLRHDHSGLGVMEKEENRRARLFEEKVQELAVHFWKEKGQPELAL